MSKASQIKECQDTGVLTTAHHGFLDLLDEKNEKAYMTVNADGGS